MNDVERLGHDRIREAISQCRKPVILVEMHRMFGDILHSTLVVRHFRKTTPNAVVWAISERYAETFATFTPEKLGPHLIVPLPELPDFPKDGPYRVRWVKKARELPRVKRAVGCGVHPWGWKSGSIVDAILLNAGIQKLGWTRAPCLPISVEDQAWAKDFIKSHPVPGPFVALEYRSVSLGSRPVSWYQKLVRNLPVPVVAIGGTRDPKVPGAIDARGCTFRQAKALICRADAFVGCGSGLSVLAASRGCDPPAIELIDHHLSMPALGYRKRGDRHRCMPKASPAEVASAAVAFMGR